MTHNAQAAPFARGDHVIRRADKPRSVETVDQVTELGGETFLRTMRSFEPLGRCIRVRAPAAEFERVPEQRLTRRAAAVVVAVVCAAFWVALVWAGLVVIP